MKKNSLESIPRLWYANGIVNQLKVPVVPNGAPSSEIKREVSSKCECQVSKPSSK